MASDIILPTAPDILTAARQRLRDWTDEQITLARARVDAALRSHDSLQDIFEASDIPDDGRNPFSAFCALLALLAHEERDMLAQQTVSASGECSG